MEEPAKKLPSRSDTMDCLVISVQRLSVMWDAAAAASPMGGAARTNAIKKLSDLLEQMDPVLEDLTDHRILEIWASPDDPPERVDLEGICMELATVLRQTSSILSIVSGRPPRRPRVARR